MGFTDTKRNRAGDKYGDTPPHVNEEEMLTGHVSSVPVKHVSIHTSWILPYAAEYSGVDTFNGAV
jgi:hypothetical protein